MSNQSDFSFIQINNSYSSALLNAIQLLARRQSTELAKKTRNSRQRKPADGVNPSGGRDCILAALNSAIAPKLKVTFKKSSPGFGNLPPKRVGDR
ncbi:hypothetical protein [Microcoleus vaginatus]|uniref:hypothetical protein n=1 Tax=Microcoleus vaginatus TaxID=119532 RepID=UPI0016881134|nr:hypothetical protein [Microcoleus sp. FACHB-84]MBD2009207.1 hypothetical protein [Microcoleus sp. FACHB-45]